MSKPRLAQLHQSGATDGQVPVWSDAAGAWVPDDQSGGSPRYTTRSVSTAAGGEQWLLLGTAPIDPTDVVFLNGSLLAPGVDYVVSGSTIKLTSPLAPGDVLVATFDAYLAGSPVLTAPFSGFTRPAALARPVRRLHRIR